MNSKRIFSGAFGAVAVAGALVLAAPAADAQPANGHENFTVIFTGSNNRGTIVASGKFGATGRVVDQSTDTADVSKAIFPGVGTFLIHITETSSQGSFNQNTCVSRFSFTDTLTFSDGTGQFAGISGTGTATGRGTFVAKRNQTGCNGNRASGEVVVHAQATLSFPGPSMPG